MTGTHLAEFLASYTSDFPEAAPLLKEYEDLCSVNADLLEAAKAVSESGIDQAMFASGFDIPPAFTGALRRLDAAVARAEGVG